jgi:hypothetical protein
MAIHVVQPQETLSSLAERYGFRHLATIWERPENAALRAKRKDPHMLVPGDRVFIPDHGTKSFSRGTNSVHQFVAKRSGLKLRLRFLDVHGPDRASEPVQVAIDGQETAHKRDGRGVLELEIPRGAKEGVLRIGELRLPFQIGALAPIDELKGRVARLWDLGYDAGDPAGSDKEALRWALEEFQCDAGSAHPAPSGDKADQALRAHFGC